MVNGVVRLEAPRVIGSAAPVKVPPVPENEVPVKWNESVVIPPTVTAKFVPALAARAVSVIVDPLAEAFTSCAVSLLIAVERRDAKPAAVAFCP